MGSIGWLVDLGQLDDADGVRVDLAVRVILVVRVAAAASGATTDDARARVYRSLLIPFRQGSDVTLP